MYPKYSRELQCEIIDNQFFSYKDNKVLDFKKIYEKLRGRNDYIVLFEPELSPCMIIKHKN